MTKVVKISKGVYASEEAFVAIGFNSKSNRYEARCYDRATGKTIVMYSHSKRLILAARPALEFVRA